MAWKSVNSQCPFYVITQGNDYVKNIYKVVSKLNKAIYNVLILKAQLF